MNAIFDIVGPEAPRKNWRRRRQIAVQDFLPAGSPRKSARPPPSSRHRLIRLHAALSIVRHEICRPPGSIRPPATLRTGELRLPQQLGVGFLWPDERDGKRRL